MALVAIAVAFQWIFNFIVSVYFPADVQYASREMAISSAICLHMPFTGLSAWAAALFRVEARTRNERQDAGRYDQTLEEKK